MLPSRCGQTCPSCTFDSGGGRFFSGTSPVPTSLAAAARIFSFPFIPGTVFRSLWAVFLSPGLRWKTSGLSCLRCGESFRRLRSIPRAIRDCCSSSLYPFGNHPMNLRAKRTIAAPQVMAKNVPGISWLHGQFQVSTVAGSSSRSCRGSELPKMFRANVTTAWFSKSNEMFSPDPRDTAVNHNTQSL